LRNQYALQQQSSAVTHEQSEAFAKTVAVAASLRDKVADFDDLFRPIRNYFYWDQHCINIPVCSAFKEIFEALDGVDDLTEELTNVSGSIAKLDALQPKLLVGTVAVSLGASFGLSVLVWQYIAGIQLSWVVLPLAVIVLLAVGSDYNLLVVSRFKEEIHAGLNTGIIRAVAGTGSVVTAAGLVFAFTMASFIVGQLVVLGQIGTTISLGLLFDTLIVRSFMTPSIAALLGRWFWWPVHVRTRQARSATTADQQHLSPASSSLTNDPSTRHVVSSVTE
jgi:uncharacterized membrane protein YdfJ with MMPL/SSD domain